MIRGSRILPLLLIMIGLVAHPVDAQISVLVDSSRDGGVWWFPQSEPLFDPTRPHQGKALADLLRNQGMTVVELPRPRTITREQLSQHRLVMAIDLCGTYSASEIGAYTDYVSSGGRLILLNDHKGNPACDIDSLSRAFGLNFSGTTDVTTVTMFAAHPITAGVGALPYIAGSVVTTAPGSATMLGFLSGMPVMGVMPFGAGQVFFLGDTNGIELVPQPFVNNLFGYMLAGAHPAPPDPTQPLLTVTVTPETASLGDRLRVSVSGQAGGPGSVNVGDIYFAVLLPDGSVFAYDGAIWRLVFDGRRISSESLLPFRRDVQLASLHEEVLNAILSDVIPSGRYTFIAIAVRSAASPLDAANWLAPLSEASFTFVDPAEPTVVLSANPPSVQVNQTTTISWVVANASSCTASGDWSGPKSSTGGSEAINVGPSAGSRTYTLSCAGAGGETSASVVVPVAPTPPPTGCELISGGNRYVKVVNNLNVGLQVVFPQFAFETNMRPGPGVCEITGLSVSATSFTVEVEITRCVNSEENSDCSSTFGPTRRLNFSLRNGDTHEIVVGSGFF